MVEELKAQIELALAEFVQLGRSVRLAHESADDFEYGKEWNRRYRPVYRPKSVLPFVNKVFERALHSTISKFYHKYNVNYKDQYGFPKNKSTNDAILKFTQECYLALNSKERLISVFLDFTKAFDTICHDILIKKIRNEWNKVKFTESFKSYLSNMSQYVQIDGQSLQVPHHLWRASRVYSWSSTLHSLHKCLQCLHERFEVHSFRR